MKKLLLALGVCFAATQAQAALIFTIGTAATAANVNNWPAAEPPTAVQDANSATKYLNFAELNTGFIFTPTGGPFTVTGINFTTANDAVERDPTSYRLLGSNSVTASSVTGMNWNVDTQFTQIAAGPLALPAARLTAGTNVTFANATGYNTFLLLFPTVNNAASANSMQIAEARLQTAAGDLTNAGVIGGGQAVPEPASALFAALGTLGLLARRRRA